MKTVCRDKWQLLISIDNRTIGFFFDLPGLENFSIPDLLDRAYGEYNQKKGVGWKGMDR